ncbi:MAG TPA: carbohydrate porin [Burkholderiales bacterium]|nr:carbohydrate porin [Burkholderiales bacterium]
MQEPRRSRKPSLWQSALAFALAQACVHPACAAPPPLTIPVLGDESQASRAGGVFGFLDEINRSSALLGDMWGLRRELSRRGISLAIQETSEYLGNTSGGTRKGFEYDGLTQVLAQLDTQRAFGHYGGLFNLSLLNIHGKNLSADNLQSLQTASGIEADDGTRLWELWYEQKFLDEDRLDVKVGQQSLDAEFMVSSNALYFVNTMFGWPMLPSADLPGGGPAYPLSAPGARLSARPVDGVTLLAGVFSGDPVRNDNGSDPQLQNAHGTSFPWGSGRLYIAEAQFSYPALGSMVEPGQAQPLGWTYRIGAWYDTEQFSDMRVDVNGLSLADPASSGLAQPHSGDYAVYAVADRLVWRDEQDPNRTAAVFLRVMGTPLSDRNLIDFSLNAGMVFHSPFRYRSADTFGIGIGYAHVSARAAQLDRDAVLFGATPGPIRGSERFVELTYQYQLKPWIQIQPDIQYVINPGAGIPRPGNASERIANELVLGVRTTISF